MTENNERQLEARHMGQSTQDRAVPKPSGDCNKVPPSLEMMIKKVLFTLSCGATRQEIKNCIHMKFDCGPEVTRDIKSVLECMMDAGLVYKHHTSPTCYKLTPKGRTMKIKPQYKRRKRRSRSRKRRSRSRKRSKSAQICKYPGNQRQRSRSCSRKSRSRSRRSRSRFCKYPSRRRVSRRRRASRRRSVSRYPPKRRKQFRCLIRRKPRSATRRLCRYRPRKRTQSRCRFRNVRKRSRSCMKRSRSRRSVCRYKPQRSRYRKMRCVPKPMRQRRSFSACKQRKRSRSKSRQMCRYRSRSRNVRGYKPRRRRSSACRYKPQKRKPSKVCRYKPQKRKSIEVCRYKPQKKRPTCNYRPRCGVKPKKMSLNKYLSKKKRMCNYNQSRSKSPCEKPKSSSICKYPVASDKQCQSQVVTCNKCGKKKQMTWTIRQSAIVAKKINVTKFKWCVLASLYTCLWIVSVLYMIVKSREKR